MEFLVTVDDNDITLPKINKEWQLCKGISEDIKLNTTFTLKIAPEKLDKLEELVLIFKYRF